MGHLPDDFDVWLVHQGLIRRLGRNDNELLARGVLRKLGHQSEADRTIYTVHVDITELGQRLPSRLGTKRLTTHPSIG